METFRGKIARPKELASKFAQEKPPENAATPRLPLLPPMRPACRGSHCYCQRQGICVSVTRIGRFGGDKSSSTKEGGQVTDLIEELHLCDECDSHTTAATAASQPSAPAHATPHRTPYSSTRRSSDR